MLFFLNLLPRLYHRNSKEFVTQTILFMLSKSHSKLTMRVWSIAQPREGDWVCPCFRLNFKNSQLCAACHRSIPPSPVLYGRWSCGVCRSHNSTNRKSCWNCETNKPAGQKEMDIALRSAWTCSFLECRMRNPASVLRCLRCHRMQLSDCY
ncbi:E3 SUMO-protein ligase RanBP2-like protein [Perkinsela sp. CCAP 1560/4]|nr:E3 SUMO-protein ligase RanBP2-like protein [Perkinsela sp. CCAP 1560/4]|eukprot:KNH04053.1 E3 SUMO-protein ligase RanBP2-like protein [Perkinsela sp. CCAP 1560/4]